MRFPVVNINELVDLETEIDAVIITPIHVYDSILRDLSSMKLKCRILSLENVIYNNI